MGSSDILKCNTERRFSNGCLSTYMSDRNYAIYIIDSEYSKNYAELQNNDKCVSKIYQQTFYQSFNYIHDDIDDDADDEADDEHRGGDDDDSHNHPSHYDDDDETDDSDDDMGLILGVFGFLLLMGLY
jgi:hypothetical protein